MPIKSYTGLPGHGKTSLMLAELLEDSKKAERPLFAGGVDGLKPGYATLLKDPTQWNAVKPGEVCTCHDTEDSEPCNSHVVPNGSKIFIDEAWKWWGHLQNAQRQQTPAHVLALAEHRHRGIDFVWTFQQPNQIYPFARGLMGEHNHVVRQFGTQLLQVFKWQELNEDVKSQARRDAAIRTTRSLPVETFDMHKSAEVHTIKRNIPWRIIMVPALVLGALVAGWLAYVQLKPDSFAAAMAGKTPTSGAAAVASDTQAGTSKRDPPKFASLYDYAEAHLPRFGQMPWTAPVYDSREVTADPKLFCASSKPGLDAQGEWQDYTCTCFTEQSTLYELPMPECLSTARRGPIYNPYKERGDEQNARETRLAESTRNQRSTPGSTISSAPVKTDVFPRSEGYQPGG